MLKPIGHKKLASDGEERLSLWIADHLSVSLVAIHDRSVLGLLEPVVLSVIDPPLNLRHTTATVTRRRVSLMRKALFK